MKIRRVLPELASKLADHRVVILTAPPGSGKTTLVPLALLDAHWLAGNSILVLEPRRLAARLSATFMSRQLGEEVGATVGYRVRFESRVSRNTRVELLTQGVLIRRLQDDPELAGVGLVIFDEFHERSLEADLALALCLDLAENLREDLRLLIMSATLDGDALSRLLDAAPIVSGVGHSHPVAIEHLPLGLSSQSKPRQIAEAVSSALLKTLADKPGDILAFLPGGAEIRQTQQILADRLAGRDLLLYPLHGDLSLAAQTAAVQPDPGGRRRIILATPIAESSVTIEGIHSVIDSGLRRQPRFDPNSGLSRLVTRRISLAAAIQRAGRAGRLGPGHCCRLWSREEEPGFLPFDQPEILSADLAPLVLELAAWGVVDPASLRWLDPPPAGHFAQGRALLQELAALDASGRITPLGKQIAGLPVHPRLGAMLLRTAAIDPAAIPLAAQLAALLSERDIVKGSGQSVDIEDRLYALQVFTEEGAVAVRSLGADPAACRRVQQASSQLVGLLAGGKREPFNGTSLRPGLSGFGAGALLALAFPDRLARRREGSRGQYRLASGRGAVLVEHDRLAACEFLAVAELDAGKTEGRIFLAAPLAKASLLSLFADRLRDERQLFWDDQTAMVKARRLRLLGELEVETEALPVQAADEVVAVLLDVIRRSGLSLLSWSDSALQILERVRSLALWQPEAGWPDWADESLSADLEHWLAPYLTGIYRADQLRKLDLQALLGAGLDRSQQQALAREAPAEIRVPSGSRLRLHYQAGQPPILAVRLQEMFGLAETPRLAGGRVPVLLQLLSPAGRPVQVTADLAGFWQGSYHQVKSELKGRYPKHHWPDDPLQAAATARAKPRKASS